MAEKFDPTKFVISLKGKDYLQVTHRVLWFRSEHPKGRILTELINVEPLIYKATIVDNDGNVLATGHGSAQSKANAVWSGREPEKAETAAIGRALGLAGYGTQFTDDFADSDDDHLADSPQAPKTTAASKQPQNRTEKPLPASNGKTEGNTRKVTLRPFVTVLAKDGGGFYMKFETVDAVEVFDFDWGTWERANWCFEGEWRNSPGKHQLPEPPSAEIYETTSAKGTTYLRVQSVNEYKLKSEVVF